MVMMIAHQTTDRGLLLLYLMTMVMVVIMMMMEMVMMMVVLLAAVYNMIKLTALRPWERAIDRVAQRRARLARFFIYILC